MLVLHITFKLLMSSISVCVRVVVFRPVLEYEKLLVQGILINGQFPGPQIDCVTNDNLIINIFNYLNEPFLISW